MQPNAAKTYGPSAGEVRAQLAKILADRKFVNACGGSCFSQPPTIGEG